MAGSSRDVGDDKSNRSGVEGYSWHTEEEVSAWLATFAAAKHDDTGSGPSFSIGKKREFDQLVLIVICCSRYGWRRF